MSTPQVCAVDGVSVAQSRAGRWVHLGELPKAVDPEHEVEPADRAEFQAVVVERGTLKDICLDMLEHHAAIHPTSDCAFAARLREALREVFTPGTT